MTDLLPDAIVKVEEFEVEPVEKYAHLDHEIRKNQCMLPLKLKVIYKRSGRLNGARAKLRG